MHIVEGHESPPSSIAPRKRRKKGTGVREIHLGGQTQVPISLVRNWSSELKDKVSHRLRPLELSQRPHVYLRQSFQVNLEPFTVTQI